MLTTIIVEMQKRVLSILEVLCGMNVLFIDSSTPPAYLKEYHHNNGFLRSEHNGQVNCDATLFDALIQLFSVYCSNARSEFLHSELIRSRRIGVQNEPETTSDFVNALHNKDESRRGSLFRIARQLLALGLLREPEEGQSLCFHVAVIKEREMGVGVSPHWSQSSSGIYYRFYRRCELESAYLCE